MSHSGFAQARGDLGFVPNNMNNRVPNRHFFGAPGNPSKKGVALYGALSKMNQESAPRQELVTPPSGESMISKRTDWLESQERKLTATLAESRSEQNALETRVSASIGELHSKSRDARKEHDLRSRQLFQDQQWVYGRCAMKLMGMRCRGGKFLKTLEEYRGNAKKVDSEVLAPANAWVLLSYPMERVEIDDGFQLLMKHKNVDENTGQISMDWAIVYEEANGQQRRPISKFSVMPR